MSPEASLFSDREEIPLADRMRPTTLMEVLGQEQVIGPGKLLSRMLEEDKIASMIFWGPPGCGKTTLARLIARQTSRRFVGLSAVLAGVKEVRAVVEQAQGEKRLGGQGIILFVDEIHRFNKGQQDAFLPFVEDGTITLIGATTENPSFELNGALLSRCRVVVLHPLEASHLVALLQRAVTDKANGYGRLPLQLTDEALHLIAGQAAGDARHALNLLETAIHLAPQPVQRGEMALDRELLQESLSRRAALYDKSGEGHYNLISALHKSLRGSDPDAALYWLARMLEGGEDGLYIARRMVRFASEDIGNADPQALAITLRAKEAFHFLGSPEGDLALAQAVLYLATAPKSNSVYTAYGRARQAARESGHLPPPLHLRNAPTRLMKELGYGAGYRYPHDHETGFVAEEYLPEALRDRHFYQPVERGFEREISRRLAYWQRLRLKVKEGTP